MNSQIGDLVECKVRFKKIKSKNAYIKVMTDGIFLTEINQDPYLKEYDTVIVDEAHERSLNIDLIIGFLSKLVHVRKNLKVILTSATLDTSKFSKILGAIPLFSLPARDSPLSFNSIRLYLGFCRDINYSPMRKRAKRLIETFSPTLAIVSVNNS